MDERGAEVALSIYELAGTSALNALTRMANLGGAYHVGVEVYWLEWSFGWCEAGSGVYMVHPSTSTLGTFRERVSLGTTPLSGREALKVLAKMRDEWPGDSYDVLRRNCAHFSTTFVGCLHVENVPDWVNSLAGVGEALVSSLGASAAEEAAQAATPALEDRVPPPMAHLEDSDLEDEAHDGNDFALREMAWRRAQVFVLERCTALERSDRYVDLTVEFQWGPGPAESATAKRSQSELLQYESFRNVVAKAVRSGLGRPAQNTDDDSDESTISGIVRPERMAVLWLKTWPGDKVRAKLRLHSASEDSDWPPRMPEDPRRFGQVFERELLASVRNGNAAEWPQDSKTMVAGIKCLTIPGKPVFGERAELSGGRFRSVLHSSARRRSLPQNTAHTLISRLEGLAGMTKRRNGWYRPGNC